MSPTIRYKSILTLVSVASLVLTGPTFAGPSPTPTGTPTTTPTGTPVPTPTVTPTGTPVPTPTGTPTTTPTVTPVPTPTGTPTTTPTPAPVLPPLTKKQRKCVNEMNKSGLRVNKMQLKENEWCLKKFQIDELDAPGESATFNRCLTQDRRDKVKKAEELTERGEAAKCIPLKNPPNEPPPPFGYTDAKKVNAAAKNAARSINYVIFGDPPKFNTVSDDILITKAEDKDAAKCQLEMLKRADKLESAVLKQIYKAKKKALKDKSVGSQVALEAKLGSVFSSNSKINKAEERFVNGVDKQCDSLQPVLDAIFPGSCGNSSLSELEDCVIAAVRCEACLMINVFDDLDLDCDQADNQMQDSSC